jgi:hypothetical protein
MDSTRIKNKFAQTKLPEDVQRQLDVFRSIMTGNYLELCEGDREAKEILSSLYKRYGKGFGFSIFALVAGRDPWVIIPHFPTASEAFDIWKNKMKESEDLGPPLYSARLPVSLSMFFDDELDSVNTDDIVDKMTKYMNKEGVVLDDFSLDDFRAFMSYAQRQGALQTYSLPISYSLFTLTVLDPEFVMNSASCARIASILDLQFSSSTVGRTVKRKDREVTFTQHDVDKVMSKYERTAKLAFTPILEQTILNHPQTPFGKTTWHRGIFGVSQMLAQLIQITYMNYSHIMDDDVMTDMMKITWQPFNKTMDDFHLTYAGSLGAKQRLKKIYYYESNTEEDLDLGVHGIQEQMWEQMYSDRFKAVAEAFKDYPGLTRMLNEALMIPELTSKFAALIAPLTGFYGQGVRLFVEDPYTSAVYNDVRPPSHLDSEQLNDPLNQELTRLVQREMQGEDYDIDWDKFYKEVYVNLPSGSSGITVDGVTAGKPEFGFRHTDPYLHAPFTKIPEYPMKEDYSIEEIGRMADEISKYRLYSTEDNPSRLGVRAVPTTSKPMRGVKAIPFFDAILEMVFYNELEPSKFPWISASKSNIGNPYADNGRVAIDSRNPRVGSSATDFSKFDFTTGDPRNLSVLRGMFYLLRDRNKLTQIVPGTPWTYFTIWLMMLGLYQNQVYSSGLKPIPTSAMPTGRFLTLVQNSMVTKAFYVLFWKVIVSLGVPIALDYERYQGDDSYVTVLLPQTSEYFGRDGKKQGIFSTIRQVLLDLADQTNMKLNESKVVFTVVGLVEYLKQVFFQGKFVPITTSSMSGSERPYSDFTQAIEAWIGRWKLGLIRGYDFQLCNLMCVVPSFIMMNGQVYRDKTRPSKLALPISTLWTYFGYAVNNVLGNGKMALQYMSSLSEQQGSADNQEWGQVVNPYGDYSWENLMKVGALWKPDIRVVPEGRELAEEAVKGEENVKKHLSKISENLDVARIRRSMEVRQVEIGLDSNGVIKYTDIPREVLTRMFSSSRAAEKVIKRGQRLKLIIGRAGRMAKLKLWPNYRGMRWNTVRHPVNIVCHGLLKEFCSFFGTGSYSTRPAVKPLQRLAALFPHAVQRSEEHVKNILSKVMYNGKVDIIKLQYVLTLAGLTDAGIAQFLSQIKNLDPIIDFAQESQISKLSGGQMLMCFDMSQVEMNLGPIANGTQITDRMNVILSNCQRSVPILHKGEFIPPHHLQYSLVKEPFDPSGSVLE